MTFARNVSLNVTVLVGQCETGMRAQLRALFDRWTVRYPGLVGVVG
ncbi:hypothetical protein [Streptomyces virginiae]|nr:hypothetical protein [Streptomyces virginiae]